MVDGFRERAARSRRCCATRRTTFVLVTSPEREPVEEAIFFQRELRGGAHAVRRRDRQPRARRRAGWRGRRARRPAGAADRGGRPLPRARRESRRRVRRRARARAARRRERRASSPRGSAPTCRCCASRCWRATCTTSRGSCGSLPSCLTPPRTTRAMSVGERAAAGKEARDRAALVAPGEWIRRRAGPTRSRCWRSRRRAACRSWCRSATGGCRPRRSPSSAARRRSWPPTSPPTPRSGLRVQLCGDAHLANFGVFASPERELVFDLNDFDETLPGPVGVGRQAARRERRGRGPRARLRRDAARAATVRRPRAVPRGDARLRRDGDARRLVRAPRRRASCSGAEVAQRGRRSSASGFEHDVAKARRKDSTARVREARRTRSTASRGSSATRR